MVMKMVIFRVVVEVKLKLLIVVGVVVVRVVIVIAVVVIVVVVVRVVITFATHATMTGTIPHMLSSTHMSSAKQTRDKA
jgi:hypothetical protein